MFRIIDILQDFVDRQTGVRSIMVEGIADTAADLPQNTAQLVYIIGSYADVIDTGDRYKINSFGQWIQQPRQNTFDNVYTKSEIDAMFAPVSQSAADSTGYLNAGGVFSSIWSQVFGLNTVRNLIAGDDLNVITTVGIYRVTNSVAAAQILNIPHTQSGGRLIVSNLGSGDRYFQIYIALGIRFYIRAVATSAQTWSHWYEYGGTDTGA